MPSRWHGHCASMQARHSSGALAAPGRAMRCLTRKNRRPQAAAWRREATDAGSATRAQSRARPATVGQRRLHPRDPLRAPAARSRYRLQRSLRRGFDTGEARRAPHAPPPPGRRAGFTSGGPAGVSRCNAVVAAHRELTQGRARCLNGGDHRLLRFLDAAHDGVRARSFCRRVERS